jgi:hypothetical protein
MAHDPFGITEVEQGEDCSIKQATDRDRLLPLRNRDPGLEQQFRVIGFQGLGFLRPVEFAAGDLAHAVSALEVDDEAADRGDLRLRLALGGAGEDIRSCQQLADDRQGDEDGGIGFPS